MRPQHLVPMLAPLTLGAHAAMLVLRAGALCGLVACAFSRPHAHPPSATVPTPADTTAPTDTIADLADTTAPPSTYAPPPESPPMAPVTVDYELSTLEMKSTRIGWATRYEVNSSSPRILRTVDGGEHFAITGPVVDTGTVCGYAFVDTEHAQVIVCTGRTDVRLTVHRTSDGGKTWSYVPVQAAEDPGSMLGVDSFAFRDAMHGSFVATVEDDEARAPVAIFRTSDGGLTWKEAGAASQSTFADLGNGHSWALQGSATSGGATLLRATDGTTFKWVPDLTGCTVEALPTFFGAKASLRANCASGVRFARTTDGGDHWTLGEETEPDAAVDFLDGDRGWVSGKRGTFATRDGGLSWSSVDGAPREVMGMTMLSATVGFLQALTDDRPVLLRTTDGGMTWRTALAMDSTNADTLEVEVIDASNVFVSLRGRGGTQLFRSRDAGESFTFTAAH